MLKRTLCLLLLPLLLFVACERREPTMSAKEVATRLLSVISNPDELYPADADFAQINFTAAAACCDVQIYLENTNGSLREVGVFRLQNDADATLVKNEIREYLRDEQEAIRSLAHLYPGTALEENLMRYETAAVEQEGSYIVYLVLGETDLVSARAALK